MKKLWSKGAGVAPYNMVGPFYIPSFTWVMPLNIPKNLIFWGCFLGYGAMLIVDRFAFPPTFKKV